MYIRALRRPTFTYRKNCQLSVYLSIRDSITTTVQHQMAGFQRGLSLSQLATRGYNNVITIHNSYKTHNKEKRNKIRASVDAERSKTNVYTEQYQEKEEVQHRYFIPKLFSYSFIIKSLNYSQVVRRTKKRKRSECVY